MKYYILTRSYVVVLDTRNDNESAIYKRSDVRVEVNPFSRVARPKLTQGWWRGLIDEDEAKRLSREMKRVRCAYTQAEIITEGGE